MPSPVFDPNPRYKRPPATFERFLRPFVFKFSKLQDTTLCYIYSKSTFTPPNRLVRELNTAVFWQEVKKADLFDKLGSPDGLESLIFRRAEYLYHEQREREKEEKEREREREKRRSAHKAASKSSTKSASKSSTKSAAKLEADLGENDQDASNMGTKKKKSAAPSAAPPPPPKDDGSGVYYGELHYADKELTVEDPEAAGAVSLKQEGGGIKSQTSLLLTKQPVSMSVPNYNDHIPILKIGDTCWTKWKVEDRNKGSLYESIVVNVYVKKEGDILYDVQVYGDTEVGRVFRIGWDDVIMDEDYIYLLELTHVKSTADSGKAPKRKRDGWITELTGEDAVYYSMKVAMRKYDDELVKKDGRQVRARALNIPDDFVFERGAAPMRSKVYTAGKEGRNPNTPVGLLPELGTAIKVTDMTVDRVLKGEKKKPKVKGGSKEGRGEEKSEVKPKEGKGKAKGKEKGREKGNVLGDVGSPPKTPPKINRPLLPPSDAAIPPSVKRAVSAPSPKTPPKNKRPLPPPSDAAIPPVVKRAVSTLLKDIQYLRCTFSPSQKKMLCLKQKLYLSATQATHSLATEHGFTIPSPTAKESKISIPEGWPMNPFKSAKEGDEGKLEDEDLLQYLEYCDGLKVDQNDDSDGKKRRSNSGDNIDSGSSGSIATAITATTSPAMDTMNKMGAANMWRCDKCKLKTFPSIEEATAHEMTCNFGN